MSQGPLILSLGAGFHRFSILIKDSVNSVMGSREGGGGGRQSKERAL